MKRPYQCDKCNQSFHNKANLEIHLASGGENNEPKNCKECQMKFCTTYSLKKHIRFVHLRLKPKKWHKQKEYSNRMSGKHVSCKNCDQRFHSRVKMEYHMKNADSLTKCEHCDYKSCNKLGVSHHMKKIHGVDKTQRFKCPKCDQKFCDRSALDSHFIKKEEDCGKKSCSNMGFVNNMKNAHRHKLERILRFKCPKCDQKFHSRVNLKYHEKAKQEVQKCEDCGFKSCTHIGFLNHIKKAHGKKSEQSNLEDSNLRNPNEEVSKLENPSKAKPYNCIKCDYKTHSKPNLDIHMKSKDEPTICEHCDFKSCTKRGFSMHMKKVHGKKPSNCTKCDYKTHSKRDLDIHMKSKDVPTICEHCDFKSCTKLGFSMHMKKIHGIKHHTKNVKTKSIQNVEDGRVFENATLTSNANVVNRSDNHDQKSLTINQISDNLKQAKPFECADCDMKFHSQSNFEFHMKNSGNPTKCTNCEFKSCTKFELSRHKKDCNEVRKSQVNVKLTEEAPKIIMFAKKSKPLAFYCLKCDETFDDHQNLDFHMKISQVTDDLEKCNKCDFKSCTINGLTKHEKNFHTGNSKTSENMFNPIKVERDSINDNVEKCEKIKSVEEFSMIGVNEDSELIVPEQLDDYDSC